MYGVCLEMRISKGDLDTRNISITPQDSSIDSNKSGIRFYFVDYKMANNVLIKQLYSEYINAHASKEFRIVLDCRNCLCTSEIDFSITDGSESPSHFSINNKRGAKGLPTQYDELVNSDENERNPIKFMKIKTPEQ